MFESVVKCKEGNEERQYRIGIIYKIGSAVASSRVGVEVKLKINKEYNIDKKGQQSDESDQVMDSRGNQPRKCFLSSSSRKRPRATLPEMK